MKVDPKLKKDYKFTLAVIKATEEGKVKNSNEWLRSLSDEDLREFSGLFGIDSADTVGALFRLYSLDIGKGEFELSDERGRFLHSILSATVSTLSLERAGVIKVDKLPLFSKAKLNDSIAVRFTEQGIELNRYLDKIQETYIGISSPEEAMDFMQEQIMEIERIRKDGCSSYGLHYKVNSRECKKCGYVNECMRIMEFGGIGVPGTKVE